MRAPPDHTRTRPASRPGAFRKLTLDGTPATSLPDGGAMVVDLDGYRARRLLAHLDLAPTVPVPCSGCCTCYGVPVGLECKP
jgi:hypothetical protein